MATDKTIVFSFIRTPDFIDNINRPTAFDINDMDGTTLNYEIVLASSCKNAIEDNLTEFGTLNSDVVEVDVNEGSFVALTYAKGVNNNRIISMGSSLITVDVSDTGDNVKGLFLRDRYTGYVLAYCILQRTVPLSEETSFPVSGVVWNIRNEV